MTKDRPLIRIGLAAVWQSSGGYYLKLVKTVDLLVGGALAFVLPGLPCKPVPGNVRRVLVIRPGGIGDAALLLSMIEAWHGSGVVVDVLCERRNEQVFLLARRFCRRILCYDRWPELGLVWRDSYDVVVDTEQWHYLSALTAYAARGRVKIGFSSRPLREKLYHVRVGYRLGVPEAENFKALVAGVPGWPAVPLAPVFLRRETVCGAGPLKAGLFWGGSITEKRLALADVVSLANVLANLGYEVNLFGGAEVWPEARQVVLAVARPALIVNQTSLALADAVARIRQCAFFIGTDSGLLHLAAACGVPAAGIFGFGNERQWAPAGVNNLALVIRKDSPGRTMFGYAFVHAPGQRLQLEAGQEAALLAWAGKATDYKL